MQTVRTSLRGPSNKWMDFYFFPSCLSSLVPMDFHGWTTTILYYYYHYHPQTHTYTYTHDRLEENDGWRCHRVSLEADFLLGSYFRSATLIPGSPRSGFLSSVLLHSPQGNVACIEWRRAWIFLSHLSFFEIPQTKREEECVTILHNRLTAQAVDEDTSDIPFLGRYSETQKLVLFFWKKDT